MKKLRTIAKEWIIDPVAENLKTSIGSALVLVCLAFLPALRTAINTWLTKELIFSHPIWLWIIIFVAIAVIPFGVWRLVQSSKRKRSTHLTDKGDIALALGNWVGREFKGCSFRRTIYFDAIDKECNAPPGTARKYLPKLIDTLKKQGFKVDAEYAKELIMIEYEGENEY